MRYRNFINANLKAALLSSCLGLSLVAGTAVLLPTQSYAQSATPVDVRSADHPGYSRLVFAFDIDFVEYRMIENANSIDIFFPSGQAFVNNGANVPPLQFINSPQVRRAANGESVIRFNKAANTMAQSFRDGFAIVVDVMPVPAGTQPDYSPEGDLGIQNTQSFAPTTPQNTPPAQNQPAQQPEPSTPASNDQQSATNNADANPVLNDIQLGQAPNLMGQVNNSTPDLTLGAGSTSSPVPDANSAVTVPMTNDNETTQSQVPTTNDNETTQSQVPTTNDAPINSAEQNPTATTAAASANANQGTVSTDIPDPLEAVFGSAGGSNTATGATTRDQQNTPTNQNVPAQESTPAPQQNTPVEVVQEDDPVAVQDAAPPETIRAADMRANTGGAGVSINRRLGLGEAPVVPVSVEDVGDQKTLVFNWHVPVGAAVFKRSGYLWVVFDEASVSELSNVVSMMNAEFTTIDQSNGPDMTVVRFGLVDDPELVATRVGNDWRITLQRSKVDPEKPLVLARQDAEDLGIRYFSPIQSPGNYLKIEDPIVGDNVHVIPILEAGMGMVDNYRQGPFLALQSAQGLVIEPMSDDVVITRYTDGVAIGSIWGQDSGSNDANLGDRAQGEVIIDFAEWRRGPRSQFTNNRQNILAELTSAPESEINKYRWDLAQFYLGHKMPHEALSVLGLMLELDQEIADKDHRFNAVRGMAHYQMRDFALAKQYLDDRRLDAEPDIYLWRTLVETELGNYEQALNVFERSRELIDRYGPETRVNFRLSAVKSALEIGRLDFAQNEIALIKALPKTAFQMSEALWLEGQMQQRLGNEDQAIALFRNVAVEEQINRRAAAHARNALIMINYNNGTWDRNRTTNELELLRFSWRGDDFEFNLLKTLGSLYLDGDEYSQGLRSLRDAIEAFPEHARRREIFAQMDTTFRDLFLNGAADNLNAIAAISLYNEFKELTPIGSRGDEMIRRLVERMVSVDLLEQAAELLDYQVRFRLEGIAQASIAAQLAKIYLMDQRNDEAIEILRATRQPQMPDDLVEQRVLVEARALTNAKRYEEAEVLLFGISNEEANKIRADIYWGANDWPRIAMVSIQMLGNRWQVPTPLSFEERQVLMRYVIAMSMQGDMPALQRVRAQYGELMREGNFANAFNTITSMQNPTGDQLTQVVRSLAGINTLRSFMDAYRREFVGSSDDD